MKVLSIGNSFSEDAHRFLQDIAIAGNVELLLVNLYIGGCSLERHYDNLIGERAEYTRQAYYPFENSVVKTDNVWVSSEVEGTNWDVITLQQCSGLSGVYESYFPYLTELKDYCATACPDAEIMFHQTWAYAKNSDHPQFPLNYHSDQNFMYESLTDCVKKATEAVGIKTCIPSGKAWQNTRKTSIGDNLTRDGFHGNDLGCYLACACFYEKIFGKSILENSFELDGASKNDMMLLKACAHNACKEGI